jgi:single-strand DNA-binding protein
MASRGLNKVQIIGNLGRDPELRYTPAGKAVANFTVAVNRVTGTGEQRQEETEWFRVVAWERLAETCQQYLEKGARVYIEGRLQSRKYTDKDGVERTSVEIVANEMLMLDGRAAGGDAPVAAGSGRSGVAVADDEAGDDLPF